MEIAYDKDNSRQFGKVDKGWCTYEMREVIFRVDLWKDIRRERDEFSLRTVIQVGNGLRTKLWSGKWIRECPWKEIFPVFFRIV